jgi:hypothetical protein
MLTKIRHMCKLVQTYIRKRKPIAQENQCSMSQSKTTFISANIIPKNFDLDIPQVPI